MKSMSVLVGFALLLVAVFGVSYAVGRQAGPVAPGLRPAGGGGSGGGASPGMGGHGMGGMR
ncbi:hypothetical protein ACIBCA_17005 [Kitasatospora sp. NPDC051170]|uniref:hypothetical protein n=1 Tax=Kitasatospora sp. NPDC051170 TaxID=3364056 RepID=UPI00378B36F8